MTKKKYQTLLTIGIVLSTVLQLPGIISGLIIGLVIFLIGKMLKHDSLQKYGFNLLISYDQVGNAATGGDPDETISSRTGKRKDEYLWARCLSAFLDIFDWNHTDKSVEEDEGDDSVIK